MLILPFCRAKYCSTFIHTLEIISRQLISTFTLSRKVSFEFLYGMCRVFPCAISTRAIMTLPSVDNDWLIRLASCLKKKEKTC